MPKLKTKKLLQNVLELPEQVSSKEINAIHSTFLAKSPEREKET